MADIKVRRYKSRIQVEVRSGCGCLIVVADDAGARATEIQIDVPHEEVLAIADQLTEAGRDAAPFGHPGIGVLNEGMGQMIVLIAALMDRVSS